MPRITFHLWREIHWQEETFRWWEARQWLGWRKLSAREFRVSSKAPSGAADLWREWTGHLHSGGGQDPSVGLHAASTVGVVQLGSSRQDGSWAFWKTDARGSPAQGGGCRNIQDLSAGTCLITASFFAQLSPGWGQRHRGKEGRGQRTQGRQALKD